MSATYTQQDRRLVIETPLGADKLLLQSFVGDEQMSRPFLFRLQMMSEDPAIDPVSLVGQKVSFSVRMPDESYRYFHGHVSRFSAHGTNDRYSSYSAEVVPWLWFLSQTADCRIFQNKTIVEIIEDVFGELGFADYETSEIRGSHPAWDYCVQYRESDFNFISRLLEQEGVFYYFRHEQDRHVLVLADHARAYAECADKEANFASSLSEPDPTDNIKSWEHQLAFRPGKVAQTDYNFEKPTASLLANTKSVMKTAGVDKYELFDYPGEYEVKGDGDSDVKLRMEEQETFHDTVSGTSWCRTFGPGFKFTVAKHQNAQEEGKGYVITGIQHQAAQPGSYVTAESAGEVEYVNSFVAIPDTATFRPARVTPRPSIAGVQTAVVTGPPGEEIHTDKFGRVKVQFHWDRLGQKNEKSSCWIRVAQPWAGAGWGAHFWPRIGHEVVVQFLEGDPDRPLIVGSVYNADMMPPYALPANQTQSGIKSRSSKGGGGADFNEIRFEDKKGSEDIYFHGQKDFHRVVENDDDLKVGNDQTMEVMNNQTETIKKGNREVVIEMGNDSLAIKMGNRSTKLDLGKDETEAMQSIELKVGQSSIKIDQMGVTIKGMMVTVEGQIQTSIKGMMTQVTGSAMLKAGGGITMIG